MVITYYGASCFRVQSGETVLAFNPASKNSDFKAPRFQADIVFISLNHKDYNGWENLSSKEEKSPFVIDGPGEYEINGIQTKGILNGLNTLYVLSFDDISVCHLGAFEDKSLPPEIKEEIGEIDVLFVPVLADDGQKASYLSSQIEPKIVIPAYYKETELKKFLKEFGNGSLKPLDKLTIKKKDLSDKKNEVVILTPAI